MDPLTVTLVVLTLFGVGARLAATPVVDVLAAARGGTPPSLERWRARHSGDPAPSYWRRIWGNASEAADLRRQVRDARRAQRYEAKLRAVRDLGPERVEQLRAKYARSMARRARVAEKLGRLGVTSAQSVRQAAAHAADVAQQYRAERAARRGELDEHNPHAESGRQAEAQKAVEGLDASGNDGADKPADVVDINSRRRPAEPGPEVKSEPEPGQSDTDTAPGGSMSEQSTQATQAGQQSEVPVHSGEVTDLQSGLNFSEVLIGHLEKVIVAMEDMHAVIQNNATGLGNISGLIENAQASLSAEGFFRGRIPEALAQAAEAGPAAGKELTAIADQLPKLVEQLTSTKNAFAALRAAFKEQLRIGEEVTAQSARNGVAKTTRFYGA